MGPRGDGREAEEYNHSVCLYLIVEMFTQQSIQQSGLAVLSVSITECGAFQEFNHMSE